MKAAKAHVVLALLLIVIVSLPHGALSKSAMAAKPIILRFTYHTPPPPPPRSEQLSSESMYYWLGEQIERRTQGRVKFQYFPGAVLGKPFDFDKMIGGEGVADIGGIVAAYYLSKIPLWAGSTLPFVMEDADIGPRALWQLYQEWEPMQKEWDKVNVKPLIFFTSDFDALVIKTPIEKFDNLKGTKIAAGGRAALLSKLAGITYLSIPIGEDYDALQKGVIDGLIAPYHTVRMFKWYEAAKYLVPLEFLGRGGLIAIGINKDVWNKISPPDQKVIESLRAEFYDVYQRKLKRQLNSLNDFLKEQGMTISRFSPEDEADVKARFSNKVLDEWIKRGKAKGIPSEEFIERYKAIVNSLR